jgi:homoserine kinase
LNGDSRRINKISLERLTSAQHKARISLKVPGSSANLGPGFDTFALALSVYTHLTFLVLQKADDKIPLLCLSGATDPVWQNAETLVHKCFARLQHEHPEISERLRIVIDSDIPVGRGLGSSASLVSGILWASKRLAGKEPSMAEVLVEATDIEGHPDNTAASLYGGFVIAGRSSKSPNVFATKMKWPEVWCPLVIVPPASLSTAKARGILPKLVSRSDAIWNLQHATLLVSALHGRDDDLLRESLDDRLHEPYRSVLLPELEVVRKILKPTPALGCVLSGSGSSLMVIVNRKHKAEVKTVIKSWMNSFSTPAKLLDLKVDQLGLQEVND